MSKYFTTEEAAQFCKASKGSVIRWIHEGKLPAAVTPGGHHRILAEDLAHFLTSMNMPVPDEIFSQPAKLSPVRVMIVDDDEYVRQMIRTFFQRQFPSFEVDEAVDGFAAGMKIQSIRPDLIILDIGLPVPDGLSVCRMIRGTPGLSHIRIIVITGRNDPVLKDELMKAGADYFFKKPISIDQLKEAIEHFGFHRHDESLRH